MTVSRRHLRWATAAVTLLTAGALAAPANGVPLREQSTTTATRSVSGTQYPRHPSAGVAYHALWGSNSDAERRAMFDHLDRLGVRWVRIGFPWALIQPDRPTATDPKWFSWGLSRVDQVVRLAHNRGIRVSFTFVGTPGWANGGKGPKYLPDNPADYARAIRFAAHRYRGKVTSWEIWNEVSGGYYLRGATMGEYVSLLCRAYPAVHRGSPRAKVVSAGTGGVDYRWVRDFYQAGAKPCFDVLAVHPYNRDKSPLYAPGSEPPLWLRNVYRVRRIMRNNHDRDKRLWFTEFGWNTGPSSVGGITPEQQAKYVLQMFRITDRKLPYVDHMAVYMAQDEDSSASSSSLYGLYTYGMKPKPVVASLRTYLAGLR